MRFGKTGRMEGNAASREMEGDARGEMRYPGEKNHAVLRGCYVDGGRSVKSRAVLN